MEGSANSLGAVKSRLMKTPRQLNRSWPRIAGLALAYLCVILGVATCGSAATTAPQTRPFSSAQATTQFAIADFDGDHRPDLATVQVGHGNFQDTQYWIAFHLSSGARQTLGITAPTGGLRITSRDVNGDDFPDIVVTTAWADRPVAVLLNDGLFGGLHDFRGILRIRHRGDSGRYRHPSFALSRGGLPGRP
jgi:hypothetical protein